MKCRECGREMLDGISCNRTFDVDGTNVKRVPHKDEEGGPCHDCKVPVGGYHHPGCDGEVCILCGRQVISCGCNEVDEEGEDWP